MYVDSQNSGYISRHCISATLQTRPLQPNRLRAIIYAAVFALLVCAKAFGIDTDRNIKQLYHTAWTAKDGAPSQISALAQTKDGYLWIGSARGLFRFDGVRFEEYQPQPGVDVPSHSIWSLLATPEGGLWIAFEPNGLGFYKDGSLTVFTRREELPDSPVHCFARDNDGRIWAGTEGGLAFRQGDRWISVSREWNFSPEMIRYLLVDREGTLWVATVKQVVYLKRGSKRFELGGPVGTGVTTLSQAPNGRVWLADNGSFEVRPVPMEGHKSAALGPSIVADRLQELLFDKDGALWITRMDFGIVRIRDPEKLGGRRYGAQDRELESFDAKDGFTGGFAHKLFEDREGNIWIGCSNGLIRFRHSEVVPIGLPQSYEMLTLLAGKQSDLWVGTISDRPLLKLGGGSVVAEKGGNRVASVLRDANGDLWWGSRAVIWRQRGDTITSFPIPKDAAPDWMWDLMPTSDNRGLWVKFGDIGLVRFNQGVWNLHDWPRGVPSVGGTFRYGPSASFRDASGRFWLGYTSGQIYLVDRDHATEYSKKNGLDLGRIKVIRGRAGHIWAGGELGLEFFSNERFWKVQTADGEPFGAVSGIIETPDSGLWLNEMRGIVQIPVEEIRQVLAEPTHPVSSRRFDYLDGLPGLPQMSYTNSTAVRTTDGRLWFATDSGLARIDPTHMTKNEIPPPVSILSIGNERGPKAMSNPVKFAARTHHIEIDYAGLSLSIPERVKFRYRLEGIDPDWQNVGTRRQAYYDNLGPGSYRFRVIACNNDGVWNDLGAFIDFSIAPAWYQTTWFYTLCAVAFLALLWTVYQLRLSQATAEVSTRLGERLRERERIARELHDTLLQGFQMLVLRFQVITDTISPEHPARRLLEDSLSRSERILQEGREKVSTLRSETEPGNDLAADLAQFGRELSTESKTPFQLTVEGNPKAVHPVVFDEIRMIAREAIANSFRHARASSIECVIQFAPRHFSFVCRDDGCGIPELVLETKIKEGHWGLVGMKERAAKIGAVLRIIRGEAGGTEVELKLRSGIAYAANTHSRLFSLFGLRRQ